MSRAAFRCVAMLLLLVGIGAGASLARAQVVQLIHGPTYPSCADPLEADGSLNPPCTGQRGVNAITLYPHNPALTAEDLCAIAGPHAGYVRQRSSNDIWTYICPGSWTAAGTCIAQSGASGPKQANCSSSCFCVECSEGVEIRMDIDETVDFLGTPAACSASLGQAGAGPIGSWLVSTPDNFSTYQAFANATCLVNTGLQRGSITCLNPVTGATTAFIAGTSSASLPFPNDARACVLRNPNVNICYGNQGTPVLAPKSPNDYCLVGTGNGSGYAWWIDLGGDNDPTIPISPGDPSEPNLATAVNETAVTMAANLVASIKANPTSQSTQVSAKLNFLGSNCFEITTNSVQFNLWVAPATTVPPAGGWCAVTGIGCTVNPTITLMPGPSTGVPTLGIAGKITLVALFMLTTAVLVRRRLRGPITQRPAAL